MRPYSVHRLQILGAALLFSTGGAAIKATSLDAWQVASFRSAVAAAAILLLVPASRRGWSPAIFAVGTAYAATMVLFVIANKLTTAANAVFLQAAAPLYVLMLSPFLLKERIRRHDLGLMALVGVGLAMIFMGTEAPAKTAENPALGDALAALSGVAYAFAVMGLRALGRRTDAAGESSALPAVVAGNVIAAAACLPLALPAAAGAADWAVVVYLGVFQIAAAYLLLAAGIRHLSALTASTLLLLEPAVNPIWAWLVHGEAPGVWSLAGGGLILGATLLKTALDGRPAPEAEVPTG